LEIRVVDLTQILPPGRGGRSSARTMRKVFYNQIATKVLELPIGKALVISDFPEEEPASLFAVALRKHFKTLKLDAIIRQPRKGADGERRNEVQIWRRIATAEPQELAEAVPGFAEQAVTQFIGYNRPAVG
jgi:hypothetical protein